MKPQRDLFETNEKDRKLVSKINVITTGNNTIFMDDDDDVLMEEQQVLNLFTIAEAFKGFLTYGDCQFLSGNLIFVLGFFF